MSILIVRKLEEDRPDGDAIPETVVSQLVARAGEAGRALGIRDCRTDEDIAAALESPDAQHAEFVLLDPGSLFRCGARYRSALTRLRTPFIEVHDDRQTREADLVDGPGAPAALVHGYASQGYVMALDIALERLGCDECGNDYHVGT